MSRDSAINPLHMSVKFIKAGEYELSAGMTPQEILKKLVSGDVFKRVLGPYAL